MKLLLGARVAVLTRVPGLALSRIAPLVAAFDLRARGRAVLVLPRAPPLVLEKKRRNPFCERKVPSEKDMKRRMNPHFVVVVLRTRVALTTKSRRFLADLRFVVRQHVPGVLPLGIVVHHATLLVEDVGTTVSSDTVRILAFFDGLKLVDVEHRWPEVH